MSAERTSVYASRVVAGSAWMACEPALDAEADEGLGLGRDADRREAGRVRGPLDGGDVDVGRQVLPPDVAVRVVVDLVAEVGAQRAVAAADRVVQLGRRGAVVDEQEHAAREVRRRPRRSSARARGRSRPSGRRRGRSRVPRPGARRGLRSMARSRPRPGCRPAPMSTASSRSRSPRWRTRWTGRASRTSLPGRPRRMVPPSASGRGAPRVRRRPAGPRSASIRRGSTSTGSIATIGRGAAIRPREAVEDRRRPARPSPRRARGRRTGPARRGRCQISTIAAARVCAEDRVQLGRGQEVAAAAGARRRPPGSSRRPGRRARAP